MKLFVLEFKLLDGLYCFNTKNVDYVFELEEFEKFNSFNKAVLGIVHYNDDVMLLIDTAMLYHNQKLNLETPKSVIVVHDDNGMKYGMVVDEIVKIEEVDSITPTVEIHSEDMIINHYKEKDEIINEIHPLPLLKKFHIPAMSHSVVKQKQQVEYENFLEAYLLFKVDSKIYGVASSYVKEVVPNEKEQFSFDIKQENLKGVIALRNEVVRVVDFYEGKRLSDILILEKDGDKIALEVDEIFDIEYFDTQKIKKVQTKQKVDSFYNYNGEIVALFNAEYFFKESKKTDSYRVKNEQNKKEFLLFVVAQKRFCIEMAHLRQVIETKDLVKTKTFSVDVKEQRDYLATWSSHTVNVFDLGRVLETPLEKEDTQTLFIEYDNKFVALVVDEIEDIVYISQEDINETKDTHSLFGGAIVYNDEVIIKIDGRYFCCLG